MTDALHTARHRTARHQIARQTTRERGHRTQVLPDCCLRRQTIRTFKPTQVVPSGKNGTRSCSGSHSCDEKAAALRLRLKATMHSAGKDLCPPSRHSRCFRLQQAGLRRRTRDHSKNNPGRGVGNIEMFSAVDGDRRIGECACNACRRQDSKRGTYRRSEAAGQGHRQRSGQACSAADLQLAVPRSHGRAADE